jgi:hypothetical protein
MQTGESEAQGQIQPQLCFWTTPKGRFVIFLSCAVLALASLLLLAKMRPPGRAKAPALGAVTLLDAKPLHHFDFGGPAVIDSVGSAKAALVQGAIIQNGVLNLDGVSAYVEFSEPLILTTGDFSVTFFARELVPTSDRAEVISQGKWFGPGFYIGYYPPERSVRLGDEWQETGTRFPGDQRWHHYALTVDGNDSCFYIDGVLKAKSAPIQIAPGGDHTRLGRQYEPWPEYFHGNVADLWIYEGRLTTDEVKTLARTRPLTISDGRNVSGFFRVGSPVALGVLCLGLLISLTFGAWSYVLTRFRFSRKS